MPLGLKPDAGSGSLPNSGSIHWTYCPPTKRTRSSRPEFRLICVIAVQKLTFMGGFKPNGRLAMRQARHSRGGVRFVVGPDGTPLSVADLPPIGGRQRWVTRRKAEVVAAVTGGLLTIMDACERYALTREEFVSWHRAAARHGTSGLRATKLQHYRGCA